MLKIAPDKPESLLAGADYFSMLEKEYLVEKLARDIVQGLRCLALEPSEKNITAAAKRRGYAGDFTTIAEEVFTLWEENHFDAYLRLYRTQFGERPTVKLKEHCEDIIRRIWDANSGRFKASQCLIMGDIQAGKTANFIGQMALAADCGVRLFIVLTGTTNYLRSQTQERIEKGFTGFSTHLDGEECKGRIGVGENSRFLLPYSYTTMDSDQLAKGTIHPALLKAPAVAVVKKCKDALENLNEIAREWEQMYGEIELPLMLIDDEADLASLNRNDEEDEPTAIHNLIIKLLARFKNSLYIGYTATPFDNLADGNELKPKDILACLPKPGKNYFGPIQLFTKEENRSYWIRNIPPEALERDMCERPLHRTLYEAFRTFLIASAIYAINQGERSACMLVNISHENIDQESVRDTLENHWHPYKRSLLRDKGNSREWSVLHKIYNDEFREVFRLDWRRIKNQILSICENGIEILLMNASVNADDRDEIKNILEEAGRTTVLVGGYTLARGVTLPGLLVSYVVRPGADGATLMQLARWFGYRGKYKHLCRIWMTEEMQDRFIDVTRKIVKLKEKIGLLDPDIPLNEQGNLEYDQEDE